MRTFRGLMLLVVASAIVKLVGLAAAWQDSAVAASAAPPAPAAATIDPSACGPDGRGLREMLEHVRAKTDELARREAELKAREAGLGAIRRVVASEEARLEAVARSLGIDGTSASVSIVRVLESMAPEDAAPILERLDDATLRVLLGRMHERRVATLLPMLNRDRAVALTKSFAVPLVPPAPR